MEVQCCPSETMMLQNIDWSSIPDIISRRGGKFQVYRGRKRNVHYPSREKAPAMNPHATEYQKVFSAPLI